MKNQMNHLIIQGNLATDLLLKEGGKKPYLSFLVANERKNKTSFIRCVAFGKTAQLLDNYCVKGQLVLIDGSLSTDKYEGKTEYSVFVNEIQFLQKPKSAVASNDRRDANDPFTD